MWGFLVAKLLLVLLHTKQSLLATDCRWTAVVNNFNNLGGDRNIFSQQHEIKSVKEVFKELVDSAIDPNDKDAKYLGFPYFLKINLTCRSLNSAMALRTAHYTGLRPVVTVSFEEPTNPKSQKQEQLEIEMTAAPFRMAGCDSEEVCGMCWYTPMPFINGSVVMNVMVSSNDLGLPVDSKRFSINVNGFVRASQNTNTFRIGTKLRVLRNFLSLRHKSGPLWHTFARAPVLILGDFPGKIVLVSDTGFEDYFAIEVSIDSCWIGSVSCPQRGFSSSIVDSIATESTLFIRQNQLVYYFVGHYPILNMRSSGSELWTRILNNVCVKKLNPVFFAKNDSEYVIALGGGWQEGEFFLINVKDGVVNSTGPMRAHQKSVCWFLKIICSILWAVFSTSDNKFFLLVQKLGTNVHYVVEYLKDTYFKIIYEVPRFIPSTTKDTGFVMLQGREQYTNRSLVPRGLALDPFSKIFYVWGNVLLQTNDMMTYIYLSNYPGVSPIKYFVLSFFGDVAFVTEADEVWVTKESSIEIKRVYPSEAWSVYNTLQVMEGSPDYDLDARQAIVTIFFDKDGMQELVYREDPGTTGRLIKRKFPLDHVLAYDLLINTPHKGMTHNGVDYIRFTHRCPFAVVRFVDLPFPQRFTRMEHYRAKPPEIMTKTGFYDERSLTVYQGLVYQLLQLHSAYHRSYADPVHDPTWRWWKNKKQDAEYYYYMASNWKSSGGIYVDMANYVKIYNMMPNDLLPKIIYLDKKQTFIFSVYLSIRTTKQSMGETAEENSLNYIWLTILLAHPEYVHADLQRHELISRGSVLYQVTITDSGMYPMQQLSGKHLLKSSADLKVARSGMNCYGYTSEGPSIKGSTTLGINIGCPPGKRLAFDITFTKNYTTEKNKRYFDCVKPDPEMPCFYFSDVFYPFFLIQDMVTGHSGRFNGSYIFTVIGGGPYSEDKIKYFTPEELVRYNTMKGSCGVATMAYLHISTKPLGGICNGTGGIIGVLVTHKPRWVCQQNSPCYDIMPNDVSAPDYFFVLKVSNREVDQTTYCDYALEFTVHVHGLRLSQTRSLFLLQVSTGVILAALAVYIAVQALGPKAKAYITRTFRRLEEALAFRAASSLTFSSSFTSQSSVQHLPSETSNRSQSPSPKQ